jgi:hypothetical protein
MSSYVTVTCVDCNQARTIVRNNKPLPQRCTKCAQRKRSNTPKTNRAIPTNKISADKIRLRDRFLEQFRDYDAPCKEAPDVWMSAVLAQRNRAKELCREKCDLVDACHAWAAAKPRETYGVFGGRDWGPKEKEKQQ